MEFVNTKCDIDWDVFDIDWDVFIILRVGSNLLGESQWELYV